MVTYGLTVGDILRVKGSSVMSTAPDATLEAAAIVLSDRKIGLVVVLERDGRLVGVLSERDIVRALAELGSNAVSMRVEDFMTRKVVVCRLLDYPDSVVNSMKQRHIRHMPVIDEGKLVGLVSIGDCLKHLLEHDQLEHDATVLDKISL